MRAVIPAAGIGKRLRPLTLTKPKVLLPVAGKPILGHILDRVIESGIREVTLIVGYYGDLVRDYVRKNYDLSFEFAEQEVRRGLGHAVGMGLKDSDEPVLILLGDTVVDMNFGKFRECRDNIIGVMEVDDPQRFGIVEVDGLRVRSLVEKPENPPSNLAIAGVYLLQSQRELQSAIRHIVDKDITTKGEYQLTDALSVMLSRNRRMQIERIKACYDCGTRETLLETNRHLLSLRKPELYDSAENRIIPPVFIHPEAQLKNCIVGPHVSIGSDTILEQSVIANSIVGEHSRLRRSVLEGSIIGDHCHVTGKTKTIDLGDYSSAEIG